MVLDGKSSQEYPLNVGVLQNSIVGLTLFLLTLITFLMLYVILLPTPMLLHSILSVIRHQISGNNIA